MPLRTAVASRRSRPVPPRSVALHDHPASIEATGGEIMLARAKVEPSHVAPLHAYPDVTVDLQEQLPFAGAGQLP